MRKEKLKGILQGVPQDIGARILGVLDSDDDEDPVFTRVCRDSIAEHRLGTGSHASGTSASVADGRPRTPVGFTDVAGYAVGDRSPLLVADYRLPPSPMDEPL